MSRWPLGPIHFIATVTVLGLAVMSLLALQWPILAEEYVMNELAPPLEDEYGFESGYVESTVGRVFTITRVVPGGALGRAGFRAGDTPSLGICRFQGDYVAAKAFFEKLADARSASTTTFWVGRIAPRGGVNPVTLVLRANPP